MSDQLCINTIRVLSADVVQKADSGHPGAPMGMAPMAHVLWSKVMRYSPADPKWWNRDRFVLSNGHACALLYSMLHLTGYEEFTLEELQRFRQLGSKTPGHPENHVAHGGIEVTTGPLGQGFSNAVGLAIAQANLAAKYNKPDFPLFDNYTFVFTGDGCLQEGVSAEAASLAGHLGLGKLIVLYDDNLVTIDGATSLSFTEDVNKRMESYGWHTLTVQHGDTDLQGIFDAIEQAKKVTDKPSLIKVRTTIGIGSKLQGTGKVHGSPLGHEDLANVKKNFGFDPEKKFYIPPEVATFYKNKKEEGRALVQKWNALFEAYSHKYPDLASELKRRLSNQLPEGWKKVLPTYKPEDPAKASRQFSQIVINKLAPLFPELIGGSADLNPSTLTYMDCDKDFQKATPEGRNIRFGVREHGMAAICNGIAAFGGFIPYGSTFFNFIGYALGAVRLSAISNFGVIYIMTHDSIGLGEDGPTHQPINSLMMMRAMPNILTIRPGDGNEVSGAYAVAIENRHRPSVLVLTRQGIPNLPGTSIEGVSKGAYVLSRPEGKPDVVLVGTGSELNLCVSAATTLASQGIKAQVVSMPCWELFREQPMEYQLSVFPDAPTLAVEAGSVVGWHEYAHAVVGMKSFGASGPLKDLFKHFGFTVDNVVDKAKKLVEFYSKTPALSQVRRPF